MNTIYVVNVYSIDRWGEEPDVCADSYYFKTAEEAAELEKIIYQKLVDLQLTEEYGVEVEKREFNTIDGFDERKELDYLYQYREYLDEEAEENRERNQRMEDEYNSLTDKQKEAYDSVLDIGEWETNKIATPMYGMFSDCKDFHAIAMEKAEKIDLD